MMTFVVLIFSIMAVSILFIHKITSFFGCQLKYRSLILSGLLTFIVNVIAYFTAPFLNRAHYIHMAILVVAAGGIVTLYNEYLIRHGKEPATATNDMPPTSVITVAEEPERPSIFKVLNEPNPEIVPESDIKPDAEVVPEIVLPHTLRSFVKLSRKLHHKKEPVFMAPMVIVQSVAEKVAIDMENDRLLKLTAVITRLGSLDAILDYAYEQKNRHNYANAIFAYKKALDAYAGDSYAPFIVIDLGNIYKERGLYDEAVTAYKNALTLPVIAENSAIIEEFNKNILYLSAIKIILSRHNMPKLPFAEIPDNFVQEIETAFKNQQMRKNVS